MFSCNLSSTTCHLTYQNKLNTFEGYIKMSDPNENHIFAYFAFTGQKNASKLVSLNLFILTWLWSKSSQVHNLFKSLSIPLPGTNQYWRLMRNHGRDPCGVRTHNPEIVRQRPPLPTKACSQQVQSNFLERHTWENVLSNILFSITS